MGKKTPILVSTIIAAIGWVGWQSPPASAKYINSTTGESIWTLNELIALEEETDTLLFNQCGTNLGCQREQFFTLMEDNPKYQILGSYQGYLFIITAINPAQNTIKVFYQNRDEMTKWFDINPDENLLTELRIGWSNYIDTPLIVHKEGYIPTNPAYLPDDFHFAYDADESTHGRGWFPAREEVEIHFTDDLSLNARGIIQYTMMSVFTNASGGYNYSSCLSSPYYQPGMECRAVFSDRSSLIFLPYINGILADPNYHIEGIEQEPTNEPEFPDPNFAIEDPASQPDNLIPENLNPEQEYSEEKNEFPEPSIPTTSTPATTIVTTTKYHISSPSNKLASRAVEPSHNEHLPATLSIKYITEENQKPEKTVESENKENKENDPKSLVSSNQHEVPLSGNKKQLNKEFPWWVFVLLVAGAGIMIWWFVIPSKRSREKEQSK